MKTKLTAEITRIHYCVPLDENQWKSLTAINARGDDRWEEVSRKLAKVGAESIEYNGHFGRNIFFAIDSGTLVGPVVKAIQRLVDYVS